MSEPPDRAPDVRLTELDREVLRACEFGRTAGDIHFLRVSHVDQASIERSLGVLERRGHITRAETVRGAIHARTERGDIELRWADAWELEVVDAYWITGRELPLVVGDLRRGVIVQGDWFRRGAAVGIVRSVEIGAGRTTSPDQVTISTDLELSAGDVLTRFTPLG